MLGKRARIGLLVATVTPALVLPASASGAVTIGETDSGATLSCPPDFNRVQDSTAPTSPSYAVPAGGGVITSWSHDAAAGLASEMRLKVFRKTGASAYLTVGHSLVEPLTSPGLKTFETQISVQAGDRLGIRTGDNLTGCLHAGISGDQVRVSATVDADPEPGVTALFDPLPVTESRLNVSATVEPDCDHDGLGDETQDPLITESCPPPADTDPPETEITKRAPNKLDKSKVKFRFTADEPGSTFECKIDKKPYRPCTSPRKVKRLDEGKHRFKVIATDAAGNSDPTAAKDKFKVVD